MLDERREKALFLGFFLSSFVPVFPQKLFEEQLKKYDQLKVYLEQNLAAQDNVLRALTEANVQYAAVRRVLSELDQKSVSAAVLTPSPIRSSVPTNSLILAFPFAHQGGIPHYRPWWLPMKPMRT